MKRKLLLILSVLLMLVVNFSGCSNTGSKLKNKVNLPPASDEYDTVLESGGGYHIVMKRVDEFSGAYDMVGVVDDNGKWVHELSKEHPLIENGNVIKGCSSVAMTLDGQKVDMRISDIQKCLHYLGEGMFALHYKVRGGREYFYILYNAETNVAFDAEFCGIGASGLTGGTVCGGVGEFHNGYLVISATDKATSNVKIISRDGEIKYPEISNGGGHIGIYSEGVFFAGNCFYDIDGNMVIDLSQYSPQQFKNEPVFKDGKCYLEISNDSGTVYYTEIDHDGNFVYEPKQK